MKAGEKTILHLRTIGHPIPRLLVKSPWDFSGDMRVICCSTAFGKMYNSKL